jgi:hypothetical protein
MRGRSDPTRRNVAGKRAGFSARVLLGAAACISLVLLSGGICAAASLEWTVKAAYLFKLPAFIDWPSGAFPSPSSPFTLCVVGDDPFGGLLESGAAGQLMGGHPIVILRAGDARSYSRCNMMFVGGDAQSVAQVLAQASGTPVLTVTDSQSDESAKGIVNFVIVDNHVRFEIERTAAARNRLAISSKLLGVAVSPAGERRFP